MAPIKDSVKETKRQNDADSYCILSASTCRTRDADTYTPKPFSYYFIVLSTVSDYLIRLFELSSFALPSIVTDATPPLIATLHTCTRCRNMTLHQRKISDAERECVLYSIRT